MSHTQPEPTPFRFKPASRSKHHPHRSHKDHHHHHHHHHRHKPKDDHAPQHPPNAKPLDPDAAFRESLFDAMADDEGAEYWEGVYGQPIHEYSNTYTGPDGELNAMSDEEYVAHVRAEMWKRTHAGLIEEKERRRQAYEQAKAEERQAREEARQAQREHREFSERVAASLRKGREREEKKGVSEAVKRYEKSWASFGSQTDGLVQVPWPTLSGSVKDVKSKEVETFMICISRQSEATHGLKHVLKKERVRWHPDKVQQRANGMLNQKTIEKVTAVFQIIDDFYVKHK